MAKRNLQDLYDRVQDSLNKKIGNSENTSFDEFLKLEVDKTYEVRFIPDFEDTDNTFWRFRYHAWKSFVTGNFIMFLCPTMFGDPSPINTESWDIQKGDDESLKEKGRALWRKEGWLANVYVVDDPTNPDNNGTVKVLKMGKQLHEKVDEALKDDDIGMKIFDLSPQGCTFKIKVTKNDGGYPSYVNSSFKFPSEIPEIGNDDDKIDEIYSQAHDLTSFYTVKSYKELKEALNYHFYERVDGEDTSENTEKKHKKETPKENKQPKEKKEKSKKQEVVEDESEDESEDLLQDDEVNDLLEGLDDD